MPYKCSLTREYCPITESAWRFGVDRGAYAATCPIQKYEDSDRGNILSDTCRHLGLSRSKTITEEINGGNIYGKESI